MPHTRFWQLSMCAAIGAASFILVFLPQWLLEQALTRRLGAPTGLTPGSLPILWQAVGNVALVVPLATAVYAGLAWRSSRSGQIAIALAVPALLLAPWVTPHGDNDGLWVLIFPMVLFWGACCAVLHMAARITITYWRAGRSRR